MFINWSIREIKQCRMAIKRIVEARCICELKIAVMQHHQTTFHIKILVQSDIIHIVADRYVSY